MIVTKYSPISIPVYIRLTEFQRLIESLLENEESKYTELYIFSDAAMKKEHEKPVEEMRKYILDIRGFKNIYINFNEHNIGLKNIENAIEVPLRKAGTVIYLEEDLIVSQNFLSFINRALHFYSKHNKIFSVSGYALPCFKELNVNHVMFSNSLTFWGAGLWAKKYFEEKTSFCNTDVTLKYLNKRRRDFCLENSIQIYLEIYRKFKEGEITPDLKIGTYMWLRNLVQAFPPESLVMNTGFKSIDESWHAKSTSIYDVDLSELKEIGMEENIDDMSVYKNNKKIVTYHSQIRRFNLANLLFYVLPEPFFNFVRRLKRRFINHAALT